jgi:hypothetical protein
MPTRRIDAERKSELPRGLGSGCIGRALDIIRYKKRQNYRSAKSLQVAFMRVPGKERYVRVDIIGECRLVWQNRYPDTRNKWSVFVPDGPRRQLRVKKLHELK